jgi:pilus assembly protein CpaF
VKPDTLSALNTLVSDSVDVVVHCRRTPAGPRVTEVISVEDLAGSPDEPLRWSGSIPVRAARSLADAGYDVRDLLGTEPAGVAW